MNKKDRNFTDIPKLARRQEREGRVNVVADKVPGSGKKTPLPFSSKASSTYC
ncbi:MAG: hypothetical protein WB581_05245 [Halobacteriota archaeon]